MPPHSLKIAPKDDELPCEIAATDSASCRRVGWTWSSHSDAGARQKRAGRKEPLIMQKVTETPSSRRRGRPPAVRATDHDPHQEVRDRLAQLMPEEALDDAPQGLRPAEITRQAEHPARFAVIDAALQGELPSTLATRRGQPPSRRCRERARLDPERAYTRSRSRRRSTRRQSARARSSRNSSPRAKRACRDRSLWIYAFKATAEQRSPTWPRRWPSRHTFRAAT
jgi:hypothetical protein